MSAPVKASSGLGEARVATDAEIIKDLLLTAALCFLILFPLVAIRTELAQAGLTWHPRYGLALGLGLVCVIGRALLYYLVWNPRARAALDISSPATTVAKGPGFSDIWGPRVAPILLVVALIFPLLAFLFNLTGLNVPALQTGRIVDLAIYILIYVMLGWGLNVVVGYAGLLDLGYVAFYAVGAYAYALFSTRYFPQFCEWSNFLGCAGWIKNWAFYITLPLAGLLAALWGVILGFPVLRLKGDYLAIVTLAFGEIIYQVLQNWFDVTSGPQGINVPKLTFLGLPFKDVEGGFADTFGLEFNRIHYFLFLYYVILGLALATYFITKKLRRLPLGRAWEALREDEIACRAMGINTTKTKLSAFAIGAAFGGFAGSFFAARQGYISPESFKYIESALILAIVVLGGLGSQIGIVFSAIAIMGAFELFRELDFLKPLLGGEIEPVQFRMLFVGIAMVVMMLFRPRGFVTQREPTVFLKEKKAIGADLVSQGHG